MGVLEQVTTMKKQGIADKEIIEELTQKGVSPKEINDALKQSQIKNAVSDFDSELEPSINIDETIPIPNKKIEPLEEFSSDQRLSQYAPQKQQYSQQAPPYPQQSQQYNYSQEQYPVQEEQEQFFAQEQYPQEQYPVQQDYANYAPSENNTDNIIEIADQIFSERIRKFQRQADLNTDAVALIQTKLENFSERLKKIENTIDKLQIAILEKVGSYGQNLEEIKKEMSMMQDSFSKMISSPKENIPQRSVFDEKEDIKESLRNIAKKRI